MLKLFKAHEKRLVEIFRYKGHSSCFVTYTTASNHFSQFLVSSHISKLPLHNSSNASTFTDGFILYYTSETGHGVTPALLKRRDC